MLKQRIVKEIQKDAAQFLTDQFNDGGVFEYSIARNGLDDLPIIMCVTDDGDQFSLSVTIWDYVIDSFSKTTYNVRGVQNEDESLSWEFESADYDAYTDARDASYFLPEIIVGTALGELEEIVSRISACRDSREYAWFFPCGLKPALNHASMMMFASNQN